MRDPASPKGVGARDRKERFAQSRLTICDTALGPHSAAFGGINGSSIRRLVDDDAGGFGRQEGEHHDEPTRTTSRIEARAGQCGRSGGGLGPVTGRFER